VTSNYFLFFDLAC